MFGMQGGGGEAFLGVGIHDWLALAVALITAAQAVTVALIGRQGRRVRSIDEKTTEIIDHTRPQQKEEGNHE